MPRKEAKTGVKTPFNGTSAPRRMKRRAVIKFVQKENSDPIAKALLRARVFDIVTKARGKGTVLNVLPGTVDIMGREWQKIGADVTRLNSVKGLAAAAPVDIYDVDTYSNPFELFKTILESRKDRNFVLIGTDAGVLWAKMNAANKNGFKAGLKGPEKLPENYERWLLKRGLAMTGGPVKMLAVWKKPRKSVLYFAWFLGRYARRELSYRE